MRELRMLERAAFLAALALSTAALPVAAAQESPGHSDFGWWGMDHRGSRDAAPAMLRVLHAAPDAPAVDVWIDGEKAVSNLSFGNMSPYMRVASGGHIVAAVPVGATEPVVLAAAARLAPRAAYTIVASGLLSDGNLTAIALQDDARPTGRNAHLRFVHVAPDAPAVDVAPQGGAPLFANVTYGTMTEYAPIPSGTHDLEARLAGTDTVALDLSGVELDRRTAYTAFAVGSASDGTLKVLLANDAGRGR